MAIDNNITSISGTAVVAADGLPVQVMDGSVRFFSENDDGSIRKDHALRPYLKSPETSPDYRLRTGRDTVLFTDSFNASIQNTNNWYYAFVTMTAAQAGVGSINFGAVQGTANTHGAYMRTYQYFPLVGTSALSAEFTFGQFNSALVTDEVWLMGFGVPQSAVLRPLDGVWAKLTSAGLEGIICFNNTEVSTGIIASFSAFVLGDVNKLCMVVGERSIEYWLDDALLAEQDIPVANGQPFLGKTQAAFMMKYCSGNVSNTNTMRVMDLTVTQYDIDLLKPGPHLAAIAGNHCTVGQNGHTQGTNVGTFAQGAVPTTAACSNTAGVLSGLGGYGVATAQATNTTTTHDNIFSSFQNPVPSINITGRNLVITGIRISAMNTGAVVASTITSLIWGLFWGSTSASLATGETGSFATATTHAPRRLPLGCMYVPVAAVIGQPYDRDISQSFQTPIVVRPGEWVGTTVHFRVGTATTSQEVTALVMFEGYWD